MKRGYKRFFKGFWVLRGSDHHKRPLTTVGHSDQQSHMTTNFWVRKNSGQGLKREVRAFFKVKEENKGINGEIENLWVLWVFKGTKKRRRFCKLTRASIDLTYLTHAISPTHLA